VCLIDQSLQIVRATIGRVRGVEQNAVVAPVPASGEIGNGHQLDCRDAAGFDVIELVDHRAEGAVGGECSDVALEENGALPWLAAPVAGAPRVAALIDHLART
jgi:hypothetical protein